MFSNSDFLLNEARVLISRSVAGKESGMTDEKLTNILVHTTLPIFSIFMPLIEMAYISADDLIPGSFNTYIIHSLKEVIGIKRCLDTAYSGIYTSDINATITNNDILGSQFRENLASAVTTQLTWRFIPPNIVEVKPLIIRNFTLPFEIKCMHPPHCNTISKGALITLRELFLSDVAGHRLSEIKFFSNISSPYGDIELNTSVLEEYASRKDSILDKLRVNQHLSARMTKLEIG